MAKVSVSITSAQCSVFLVGMEMPCPLCRTVVRSGEHHECKVEAVKKVPAPKKRRRA